jgi:hypothetical protein
LNTAPVAGTYSPRFLGLPGVHSESARGVRWNDLAFWVAWLERVEVISARGQTPVVQRYFKWETPARMARMNLVTSCWKHAELQF